MAQVKGKSKWVLETTHMAYEVSVIPYIIEVRYIEGRNGVY